MPRTGPPAHHVRGGSPAVRIRRAGAVLVAAAVLATALGGCFTGERPTLGTTPTASGTATGDPNVDAVLALLDAVDGAVFTATYRATLRFGGTVTDVTVTQSDPSRRAVTVGDTRFIIEPGSTRTCSLTTGVCADAIDQQPISDTGVTSDLVFGDVAKRLRRFAGSRTSATTSTQSTIAGQPATCIDLPVSAGTSTYCVLADGVLARLVDGDVTVEMTTYSPSPDLNLFTVPLPTGTTVGGP